MQVKNVNLIDGSFINNYPVLYKIFIECNNWDFTWGDNDLTLINIERFIEFFENMLDKDYFVLPEEFDENNEEHIYCKAANDEFNDMKNDLHLLSKKYDNLYIDLEH